MLGKRLPSSLLCEDVVFIVSDSAAVTKLASLKVETAVHHTGGYVADVFFSGDDDLMRHIIHRKTPQRDIFRL